MSPMILYQYGQGPEYPRYQKQVLSTRFGQKLHLPKILLKHLFQIEILRNYLIKLDILTNCLMSQPVNALIVQLIESYANVMLKYPSVSIHSMQTKKTERLQVIGGVDMEITAQFHDRTNRILAQQRRAHPENENMKKFCLDFEIRDVIDPIDSEETNKSSDPPFEPPRNLTIQSNQNRYTHQKLAATADIFRTSNREVVALVNAALIDLNLLTSEVTLTCSKIQRERKKAREFIIKNHPEKTGLSCIMFDGRRDWTLSAIETNDKLVQRNRGTYFNSRRTWILLDRSCCS